MLHFPRWQVISIVVFCVLGVIFSLPNLVSERTLEGLPSWLPKRQVSLGLDLQGGSHLLLEVNFAAAFAERTDTTDTTRRGAFSCDFGCEGFFDEGIPLAARVAAALPFGVGGAAIGTMKDGLRFRH